MLMMSLLMSDRYGTLAPPAPGEERVGGEDLRSEGRGLKFFPPRVACEGGRTDGSGISQATNSPL